VGWLLTVKAVRKVIASAIGANPDTRRQRLDGKIEVEPVPQGTLAERIAPVARETGFAYAPSGA
jgi:acetate CoA/acetoacetate CoA-transferase alpha subunit